MTEIVLQKGRDFYDTLTDFLNRVFSPSESKKDETDNFQSPLEILDSFIRNM